MYICTVNASFNIKNDDHLNMIRKLKNSITDLNFCAFRFLERAGIKSTPRTGLIDAATIKDAGRFLPDEIHQILIQHKLILNSTPETANEISIHTWKFVHDFDHLFKTT